MTVHDALAIVAKLLRDEVCICSNGYMSRAAFGARDSEASFYMIGSMGLASSIGLGIAMTKPTRRVVVFDGDGNVLMNMGALATIAAVAPKNFVHLCFDNGVHASTGGQRTISDRVPLDAMARTAGYRWTRRVDTAEALQQALPEALTMDGPTFLLVRTVLDPAAGPGPRIPFGPVEMTTRMRQALAADT